MTIHAAHRQLMFQLYELYDDSEAANIADMVIEYITGQRKIDRIMHQDIPLAESQAAQLQLITQQLLRHIPVQYALHEAWFAGMKLYVDESVLIPRPETEELVEWIAGDARDKKYEPRSILDIGTGSGCIPIALKKKIPAAVVRAIEVSEGAMNVAVKNAMLQAVQVYFMRLDFLDRNNWAQFGKFHIIVSNPPYVKQSESASMHRNVLDHEPHLALFVPDEDALLFYRHIAAFADTHLEDNGAVYLEINEALGKEVTELFESNGYATEIKKDMQEKERMIKATRVKK